MRDDYLAANAFRRPARYPIYEGASSFGATVHVMAARVDSGPIVAAASIVIPPRTGVERLQELAYVELAKLFWRLAPALATQPEPLPTLPIQWSGTKSSRRSYAAICDVPSDIAREELERRIAAFGAGHYGIPLSVTLHGHRFEYVAPKPAGATEPPRIVPADNAGAETVTAEES